MPLNARDAQHFCRRVGFGATQAEINHFKGRERADVVDEVLNLSGPLPSRPGFVVHPKWWEQRRRLIEWWMDRMVAASWVNRSSSTPSPLAEKMALFWHGHFACSLHKVEDTVNMWELNQVQRRHALSDFETLVKKVSLNGAMMRNLDNDTNRKGHEQENFARELMELHTIGVGNFKESDVVQMSRAWTGHSIVGWNPGGNYVDCTYRFNAGEHDSGTKTIFGKSRNWDGPATITELVKGSQRGLTSKFIARKLWMYFVNGDPTAAQIDSIASAFSSGGMSVKAAMRAILMHPTFWAEGSRHAIVRPSVEWQVDILRRMAIPAVQAELEWLSPLTGQYLFEPPDVAGWGTHDYWVSTSTTWGKGKFVDFIGWQDQVVQRFKPIENMTVDQANLHVLKQMGLNNLVSPASNQALRRWISEAKAGYEWTLKHNAFRVAAMLPEFQTA